HDKDDPDPARSGRRSSPTAVARGARRHVAVRLPAPRARSRGRAADSGRAAGAPRVGRTREAPCSPERRRSRRASLAVIVADASVILELLLQTRFAAAVERRLL